MSDWPSFDDPLQALHLDTAQVFSTVGAKRPVSRSCSKVHEVRGSPKTTSLFVDDSEFGEAVARRLDRVVSRQSSSEWLESPQRPPRLLSRGSSGVGTPRTPTPTESRNTTGIFHSSSPTSSKRSSRSSSRKQSTQGRRGLTPGLREFYRAPRSLFSLIGVPLHEERREPDQDVSGGDDAFISPWSLRPSSSPFFSFEEDNDNCTSKQELGRPSTVDTASLSTSMRNQAFQVPAFSLERELGISPSKKGSSDSLLTTLLKGDAKGPCADEDPVCLSKLGRCTGDYGQGGKAMSKSSSAPILSVTKPLLSCKERIVSGDPIVKAKRMSAISAGSLRYTQANLLRAQNSGAESKMRSNVHLCSTNALTVAPSGSGSEAITEEPTRSFEACRAGTAPARPRRRRSATVPAGLSGEHLTSDSNSIQNLYSAADGAALGHYKTRSDWLNNGGGSLRLSSSHSMPSLLSTRTFNYFSAKDQRRPMTTSEHR